MERDKKKKKHTVEREGCFSPRPAIRPGARLERQSQMKLDGGPRPDRQRWGGGEEEGDWERKREERRGRKASALTVAAFGVFLGAGRVSQGGDPLA